MKVDNLVLQMSVDNLEKKVAEMEKAANSTKGRFSFKCVRDKDPLVHHYTGLPTAQDFDTLLALCSRFTIKYQQHWQVESITKEDQLFITLMKLRCNFSHMDLATRWAVGETTISNVIDTWINVLHSILYEGMLLVPGIPSVLKNQTSLPACFSPFTSCRIVLDCTEIQCAIPSHMEKQCATFSHYKQRNTFKALVGVAPNGVITYVSQLYPGSTSDKEVVRHSKVLEQTVPGDLVLADKGFLIQDLMPQGVTLNLPPFLTTGQFTRAQCTMTATIARARIHVERAIQRIKRYDILNFIPVHYRSKASKIFQVCCCLVNLQNPLLKEVEK